VAVDRLAVARKYLGLKVQHQGRNPAVALDCVGYCRQYLIDLGYQIGDRKDYSRDPDGSLRMEVNKTLGEPIATGEGSWKAARPGDVLSIRYARERHVAIASELYGELAMIHADNSHGKIVEHPMDDRWKRRVVAVWRPA
jgi:cell wall-associated NlpC family hydrolase